MNREQMKLTDEGDVYDALCGQEICCDILPKYTTDVNCYLEISSVIIKFVNERTSAQLDKCLSFTPKNSGELREKIEAILEPTLDRLYHQDLPEGKYEEIAIKASIDMLKSNLTTQILSLFPPKEEEK